ncbi:MAG: branched-chain amino acid ABC transporter permease [Ktedonobacteraceae bacterium]|nr:branched-chain amino acid ABC transporter permease [Ktedonobacteraceae bacterium]
MRRIGILVLGVCLALLLAFPMLFSNPAVTTIAVFTLIFAGAATSWNIFSGYTGYISLGHAAFYGVGAYTITLLCKIWQIPGGYMPFLLIPLAGLLAALFAIPLGWIALRTRQYAFVIMTIAFLFIMQLLAYNIPGITNGSNGVYLPVASWSSDFFNMPFYYVALTIFLLALGVSWWIRHSKYGLSLLAIRDDEDRAQSLGVNTRRHKLTAFVISASLTGMAGALLAYFVGIVSPPSAFDPSFDVTVALMTFMGGSGTLLGPIVGAFLIVPLQQYLTLQYGQIGLDLVLYGALLLLVILLLPEGIIPTLRRRWSARRNSRLVEPNVAKQEQAWLVEGRKKGVNV